MKKKVMLCALAFALVLTCVHAMAAANLKISNPVAKDGSGAKITEVGDQRFTVAYTGQKDKQYVIMVVSEEGVDENSGVPTKESISNDAIVYMNQTEGNAEGEAVFTVAPNIDPAKTQKGDKYFVYMSSNEASGSGMKQIGSFTIDELLALLGDVNGDGKVDVKDRAYLTRFVAHWEGYDVELNVGDLNDDGQINVKDRAILTRFVAHWEGYDTLPYKS